MMKKLACFTTIALLVAVLMAATSWAGPSQARQGVATPYFYKYDPATGNIGSYYLAVPTLAANDTAVGLAAAQTLTNKTLTAPVMSTFKVGAVTFTLPTVDGTANQVIKTNGSGVLSFTSAGAATAWDDLGAPDAAKTHAMTTYAQTFTSTKTNGDMFNFQGLGDFGDVSVVRIESKTGNPTDGTVLEVVSHDTDADALVVTANSIDALKVNGAGTVTVTGKVTGASPLIFEGNTVDGTNVNTFAITDPTAARTTTFPDASGTVLLNGTATHNYSGAHADWTLSVSEAQASFITATNADAGANVLLSAANAGKCFFIYNASGQILTFKVTGQTGGTIANTKRAYYCSDAVDVYEIWEQS
jgi:hypothetical protein